MSLKNELEAYSMQMAKNMPVEALQAIQGANQKLILDGAGKNALKKGDKMPAFTLSDALGKAVNIAELAKDHFLILVFYRGAW